MNNPIDHTNLIHWERHSLRCLVAFCDLAQGRPVWCDEYYASCRFKKEELSTRFFSIFLRWHVGICFEQLSFTPRSNCF